MKFVKGVSLFVVYPLIMLGTGFFAGVKAVQFFYPGSVGGKVQESVPAPMDWTDYIQSGLNDTSLGIAGGGLDMGTAAGTRTANQNGTGIVTGTGEGTGTSYWTGLEESDELSDLTGMNGMEQTREASSSLETLSVDTEYVLEETDIIKHTVVETVWKLPHKYVGMNREQFLAAMESYAAYPPLSEQERGFVGLEVLSFSRERVVIQMNYQYLQPGEGFYLAVENNEVVVYLEDQRTIFISTGIQLDTLPDRIQMQIIQMLWMEDEESLYNFLETYSS